jgi:hypothetical protein
MTHLSTELREHFASMNHQISLRKHAPDILGMDFTIGWRPVEVDSLPEEIRLLVRQSFEVRNGHAHRGVCLLAVRSFEAQDYQREQTEEIRRAQEDDVRWAEAVEAEMQQLARSTGRATGRSLLVGNVPFLRDQVLGGEKLAPIVEQELRRERRGRPPRTA